MTSKHIKPFWHLVIICYVLAAGIIAVSYWHYQVQKEIIRGNKKRELASLTSLKASQIAQWRRQLFFNAVMIRENKFTDHILQEALERPGSSNPGKDFSDLLIYLKEVLQCECIMLLDSQGDMKCANPGCKAQLDPGIRKIALQAMLAREPALTTFYAINGANEARFSFLVPVLPKKPQGDKPLGVLVFQFDPYQSIYPLLQAGTPEGHAIETLLVGEEDGHMVFLNENRVLKKAQVSVRLPKADPRLATAIEAHGADGVTEGLDYRGERVMAGMFTVPETPWRLATKVDAEEVIGPIREYARLITALELITIFCSGLLLVYFGNRHRAASIRFQVQLDLQRQLLARHLEYLTKYANDIILLADQQGTIVEANERAPACYGYSREELLQLHLRDLVPMESRFKLNALLRDLSGEDSITLETQHQRRDGALFPVEVSYRITEVEGKTFYQCIIRDITERREADAKLLKEKENYQTLVDKSPLGISLIGEKGEYLYVNPRFEEIFGYGIKDIPDGKTWFSKAFPDKADREQAIAAWKGDLKDKETGVVRPRIFTVTCKVGIRKTINFMPVTLADKTQLVFCEDITESRKSEQALLDAASKWRTTFDSIGDAICLMDNDGKIIQCNRAMTDLVEKPFGEIIGHSCQEVISGTLGNTCEIIFPPFTAQGMRQNRICHFNERWFNVSLDPIHQEDEEGSNGGVFIMSDITDQKKAEETLRQREEDYFMVVNNIPALVFKGFADGRINFFDTKIEAMTSYPKDIFDFGLLKWTQLIVPEDIESAKKTFLQALKTNQPYIREYRIKKKDGDLIWVQERGHIVLDQKRHIEYVGGVLLEITERKRAEELIDDSYRKLQNSLRGTVTALSSIVEQRDPYTAGHQRQVTDLALAIGQELGMTEHQLEGLRMAGILHDIGKIKIPAEILSNPGRLDEAEFNLIKIHPRVGYEITKGIDFPWPVAQALLQHHERENGTGYPLGLKGKEIILEAKILAVADVVDAMASHRPYRPSLGIDKALEEITRNKGVIYDREVVEACVKVCTEKGFKPG